MFSHSIHGVEKKQFPYMLTVTNMLLHDIDEPDILHGNSLTRKVLDYTDEDKFDKIFNPPYGGTEKPIFSAIFPPIWRIRKTPTSL